MGIRTSCLEGSGRDSFAGLIIVRPNTMTPSHGWKLEVKGLRELERRQSAEDQVALIARVGSSDDG